MESYKDRLTAIWMYATSGVQLITEKDKEAVRLALEHIQEQDAEIALLKEKLKEALLHKVGPRQRNVEAQTSTSEEQEG